jgi:hypothetical protein
MLSAPYVRFGVLRDARARQRRQRLLVAAVVAVACALTVALVVGRSGGERSASPAVGNHGAGPVATVRCLSPGVAGGVIGGSPSADLLSILGVLRRPPGPADLLPIQAQPGGLSVYGSYIRNARTLWGRSFYVMANRVSGCGRFKPRDGVGLACVQRVDGQILDAQSASGVSANRVEHGALFLNGGSCLQTASATLIAGVVPDGVATITVRYPTDTITATVVNNVVVASVPHPGGPLWRPVRVTWRDADGHTINTLHRL